MSIVGKNAKGTHLLALMEGRTCQEAVVLGSLEELKTFVAHRLGEESVEYVLVALGGHDWVRGSTHASGILFRDVKFFGHGVLYPCTLAAPSDWLVAPYENPHEYHEAGGHRTARCQ